MTSKALIDTEVYLFRAAAAAQFEAEWQPDDWTYLCRHLEAQGVFQDAINGIRDAMPDHRPVLVFSDGTSFRYGVYPSYKSNRKNLRKPAGYRQLMQWVAKAAPARDWEVATLPDVEGDDALGILYEEGDIIVSVDKDMLTLPGVHYRNGEILVISEDQADRAFYAQALSGDAADGYPGCPGIGPVKAARALEGCVGNEEMWAAVVDCYRKAGLSSLVALQMARCARILRPGEYDLEAGVPLLWKPPVS